MADENNVLTSDEIPNTFTLRDTDNQTIFVVDPHPTGTHYLRFFKPDGQEIASINMHTGAVRTTGAAAGADAAHLFWEAFGPTIAHHLQVHSRETKWLEYIHNVAGAVKFPGDNGCDEDNCKAQVAIGEIFNSAQRAEDGHDPPT